MTRPTDPRRNARRGASPFGEEAGYDAANHAAHTRGKRWPAPNTIYKLNAMIRQRERTGLCVVCGQPAGDMGGATCKRRECIRAFVMGKVGEPFTVVVERMEY